MYVRLQPSIQYKGGMIHEIFKGKGHHFMCASYRDVLLANDSGKQLSKSIRRKLIPRAKQLVFSSQYGGGFNGGETSFTHLYVRIILDTCRAMNISSAILFLDVVTAFAMMLRRTVFDLDEVMKHGSTSYLPVVFQMRIFLPLRKQCVPLPLGKSTRMVTL